MIEVHVTMRVLVDEHGWHMTYGPNDVRANVKEYIAHVVREHPRGPDSEGGGHVVTLEQAKDARAAAMHAVIEMVNTHGRPEVSKIAMLKVIQRLELAVRDFVLAEARKALEATK